MAAKDRKVFKDAWMIIVKRQHDTQHNGMKHNDTQHNGMQHNDTQHNWPYCDTQHKRHSA
jgi:hypothetical protein